MKHLVIATRGSRLARIQADIVAGVLWAADATLKIDFQVVTTTGDRDRRDFAEIGGRGVFVKEVEQALLDGSADLAVHSAKDVTAELAPGCELVCVPTRAAAHDVVVGGGSGSGRTRLESLAPGARVGTSSMRRRALIAELRSDLEVVALRGNLDTRLEKVTRGDIDAAILAAAGIARLESSSRHLDGVLDPEWWIPAPGQGTLVVEAQARRDDVRELLAAGNDAVAQAELECERAFSVEMEGGCSVPLGCRARVDGARLEAWGYLGSPDGGGLRDRIAGAASDAHTLGRQLAHAILASGGRRLRDSLRPHDDARPAPP